MEEVTAAVHSLEPTTSDQAAPLDSLDGLVLKLSSLKRKVRRVCPPSVCPMQGRAALNRTLLAALPMSTNRCASPPHLKP
jgi:hypothetical protein